MSESEVCRLIRVGGLAAVHRRGRLVVPESSVTRLLAAASQGVAR